MRELTCTVCPKGCRLSVDETKDFAVTGAGCRRGEAYGKAELTDPRRTLTTTVVLEGGALPRLPVKTDRPIPKDRLRAAMDAAATVHVSAPVTVGQVLLRDICHTGADLVATRSL